MIDPGKRPCVVVADDEQPIRDVMRMKLVAAGFDVHTASCGDDAWEMIQTLAPDTVILDYQMPGLTGVEVATRMMGEPKTANIKVIGISSKWDALGSDMKNLINVVEFVHKPFSPRKLVAMVQQVVGVPSPA